MGGREPETRGTADIFCANALSRGARYQFYAKLCQVGATLRTDTSVTVVP